MTTLVVLAMGAPPYESDIIMKRKTVKLMHMKYRRIKGKVTYDLASSILGKCLGMLNLRVFVHYIIR